MERNGGENGGLHGNKLKSAKFKDGHRMHFPNTKLGKKPQHIWEITHSGTSADIVNNACNSPQTKHVYNRHTQTQLAKQEIELQGNLILVTGQRTHTQSFLLSSKLVILHKEGTGTTSTALKGLSYCCKRWPNGFQCT